MGRDILARNPYEDVEEISEGEANIKISFSGDSTKAK